MLEMIDLKRELPRELYREKIRPLRLHLHECQRQCLKADIATTILFEGWDAAGKGTHIGDLAERLDPRGFRVHPISAPDPDELLRPFLWRFWIRLPDYGHIAMFDRSWYGRVLVERIDALTPDPLWQAAYEEIREFERQVVDDGMVLLKFWMHISKKEQYRRFRACERDPLLRWKITKEDWKHHRQYDQYLQAVEEMLETTSTHYAPWAIIEATNRRFAHMKILETMVERWEVALKTRGIEIETWKPVTLVR
jgi:AMP-polyphosphate phosphotransferase